METAICPAHGSRYPWAQDCPECTKEARRLGMSVDRYYSNVRPFLASERLKDRPMTSEIKPEDVKLPEPMRIMVGVEGFQFQALDVTIFTADQVRAAVLEAIAQDRERAARIAASAAGKTFPDEFNLACELIAAAIRAGHSVTETKRD